MSSEIGQGDGIEKHTLHTLLLMADRDKKEIVFIIWRERIWQV